MSSYKSAIREAQKNVDIAVDAATLSEMVGRPDNVFCRKAKRHWDIAQNWFKASRLIR